VVGYLLVRGLVPVQRYLGVVLGVVMGVVMSVVLGVVLGVFVPQVLGIGPAASQRSEPHLHSCIFAAPSPFLNLL
jgi:hypothetical protein